MIEIRRLHPSEFDVLKGFADGYCPDAEHSIAVVASNGKHMIGRIFLVAPTHVEGIYIERPWRNGPVMRRLVEAIELEAKAEGISKVMAYAKDATMADYIERLGYRQEHFTVWSKELPCPH